MAPPMTWVERLLSALFHHTKDIAPNGDLYLRRWTLLGYRGPWSKMTSGWGRLVLHKAFRSDSDRNPHDHPGEFLTIPICRTYIDEVWGRLVLRSPGRPDEARRTGPVQEKMRLFRPRWRSLDHLHRLIVPEGSGPVWTLVWMLPAKQPWGFVDQTGKWTAYAEYLGR